MLLAETQISFYQENGYLVVENAISADLVALLREVMAGFQERAKKVKATDSLFDVAPGHGSDSPKLRRVKNPVDNHPEFNALMRSDTILDIVAPLLGGTVRFDHSKLNFKPAGGQTRIEWHQDWAFYPHTNDDLLAVGVMIEDCTEENGPLQVIPGSHKGPVYNHHHGGLFTGGIAQRDLEDQLDRAISLTAPAGSVSVHHVRTLHASSNNRSTRDRPLLLFSYSAVDAFPVLHSIDLAEYDSRILRGEPTLAPRAEAVPMRLPLPRAENADSIFDNQAQMAT